LDKPVTALFKTVIIAGSVLRAEGQASQRKTAKEE
jgi:hypothetical protein